MKNDEKYLDLAIQSAVNGFEKSKEAQNKGILGMFNGKVALWLARNSWANRWALTPATQDIDILKMCDGEVAYELAINSHLNRWASTPASRDRAVQELYGGLVYIWLIEKGPGNGFYKPLKKSNEMKKKDYLYLAKKSYNNGFGLSLEAQNKGILKRHGGMVAYWLAYYSRTNGWARTPASRDKEVQNLLHGIVLSVLLEKSRLNGFHLSVKPFNEMKNNPNKILDNLLDSIDPKEFARTKYKMLLSTKIEIALEVKGWSKQQLMDALEIKNKSTIKKWFSGTHNFDVDTLIDIQSVLEIDSLISND